MIETAILVVGVFLAVFGISELITAWKIRKISKKILKQNDELWALIGEGIEALKLK